ncbi:MAG: VCBS repeat-containing protein [Candidatus Omnitrophota bacterium]|nr:MAG: VCBS repeat-containing protein [Candidatus Omnitrophota bacterium]
MDRKPKLSRIPDLRMVLNRSEINLLNLDDYVHDTDTPNTQLNWSVETESNGPAVHIDSAHCLSVFHPKTVGVFASTVSVSDGDATASQTIRIKVSHFLLAPFFTDSPIVLSASEEYRSEFSLYDGIIPPDFPKECIRWEVKSPFPEGIAHAEVLSNGRLCVRADSSPPRTAVILPICAKYQTPLPTIPPLFPTPTPSFTPVRTADIEFYPHGRRISFNQVQSEIVGDGPVDVAAADFNRDGNPDFLTANFDTNTASLLLSDAHRQYQRMDLYTGEGCQNVLLHDGNGDGWDDVITLSVIDSLLTIYLGNAGIPEITDPIELFDGFPYPEERINRARIRLMAAGHFTKEIPSAIAVADVDALNLYRLDPDNRLRLLRRESFAFEPIQLAAVDFNADGLDELLATHAYPSGVSVFSLQSDRPVLLFYSNLDITFIGNIPQGLFVKDLDADGYPDAAIPFSDGRLLILFGGETYDLIAQPLPDPRMVLTDITGGDYDGDGMEELLLAGLDIACSKPVLSLLYGEEAGRFTLLERVFLQRPYPLNQVFSLATCDVNADGMVDVVMADRASDQLIFYINAQE